MSRRLWLDPTFGASGDMVLGALLSLGADDSFDRLLVAIGRLDVAGWSIDRSRAVRAGLTATRVEVSADVGNARRWSEIDALIAHAALPPTVTDGARRTFRLLGEVEAAQHGVDIDDVHFHEVGAVDAIVDIVGTWWLLAELEIDDVRFGPVGLGHGTVRAAHGALPIPAPATLELLRGAPVRPLDAAFETCTPTGAALLRTMGSPGPIPSGTIVAAGRGAGGKDPSTHPNVITAIVVEDATADGPGRGALDGSTVESAIVLSTNVDDVTPEVLGHLVDVILAAGADDAWIANITMKKGRPAHQVCALVDPAVEPTVRAAIAAETGTLGLRSTMVTKYVAPRRTETIEIRGATVRMKVGPHGAKPEHDDLLRIARRDDVPLRVVAREALALWSSRS
ncbi:MAG: hypothetical protein RLZZ01_301 [Actinomycetota bacterium]